MWELDWERGKAPSKRRSGDVGVIGKLNDAADKSPGLGERDNGEVGDSVPPAAGTRLPRLRPGGWEQLVGESKAPEQLCVPLRGVWQGVAASVIGE